MRLKLIDWNKSIEKINIIITTNEQQERPPTIKEKFPRRQLWGGILISKSWYHTLTLIFSRELLGCCHNLQLLFWNFSKKISVDKIYCMENCLPPCLPTRMVSPIFSCAFFRYFQQVRWWSPLKWVIIMCLQ